MKKRDLKKIFLGYTFIFLSFILLTWGIYLLRLNPQIMADSVQSLTETEGVVNDVKSEPISINSVVKHAQTVYGDAEKNRIEGSMWIDKSSSKYIVTLGILNGVSNGSLLNVYDGDKKIGTVLVESALDVISFVIPQNDLPLLTNDYYRILIKDNGL